MFINPSVMIESGQQEINYPIHQDISWLIFLLILLKMRNSNNLHFVHFKNPIRLAENGEMSNRAN